MPLWNYKNPPVYFPNAVATKRGWEDPTTGEVLIAISDLAIKADAASVLEAWFDEEAYLRGDEIAVYLRFNERVDVTEGASIVVNSTGTNRTLYALAQTNTNIVLFNKAANLTDAVTVPDEAAVINIGSQTLGGTIQDAVDLVKATGVFTATANLDNGDQIVLGAKTYAFQTTLTNSDGNIKIGATAADTLHNLEAAMSLAPDSVGVLFATAMTAHTTIDSYHIPGALTIAFTAKTGGTGGNSLATTTTSSEGSFGAVTLTGGAVVASDKVIPAAILTELTKATGVFTAAANLDNGDQVVLDAKTYTFQTTLTNSDGNIKIGATAADTLHNLEAAMSLAPDSVGVLFATAMTAHTTIDSYHIPGALTIAFTAKTGGAGGNSLDTTTTSSKGSFGAATLTGGTSVNAVSQVIKKAAVDYIEFGEESYARGDELSVIVTFDGTVDIPEAGASIVVASTQSSGAITLYASEQSGVLSVVFDKTVGLEDPVVIPDEAGTLSIAAQTLGGTIYDAGTELSATKTVSSGVAGDVDPIVIPVADILSVEFDEESYDASDPISVTVTYDYPVDVTEGASIIVTSSEGSDITLYAAAQLDTDEVAFDKAANFSDPVTLPVEASIYSIGDQTLGGTIEDESSGTNAVKDISEAIAEAAGTREVTI